MKAFKKTALGLLAMGMGLSSVAVADGAMVSGSISVSLTIVAASESSNSGTFSQNGSDYAGGRYIGVLTDVADGTVVGIYVNGVKVASTTAQNGVVGFELKTADADKMNVTLRAEGREITPINVTYSTNASSAPIMKPKTYTVQIPVTNADGSTTMQTTQVKTVELYY